MSLSSSSSSSSERVALVAVVTLVLAGVATACQGGSDSASSASAPPAPAPATCEASAATDIAVSPGDPNDLNGFPPYAAAGCSLAYVNSAGALVLRDLSTRAETILADAAERPRRPTASAELVAWEADESGHSVVRVRTSVVGSVARTVPGGFVSAGEPRASGASVAFTGWLGAGPLDDTDVFLFDAASGQTRLALGGAGQQRFADLSSAYVAVSDFSEDPDGRYDADGMDLADIVLLDRVTGAVVKRALPGKQAFPMLADNGVLAYLSWAAIHPEPKLTSYELRSGTVLGDPQTDKTVSEVYYSTAYARPAVVGATLEWVANPDGNTTLYRSAADGSGAPVAVKGLESFRLYAPAPTAAGFTVLATSQIGATSLDPRLRAVAR